jgi:hypothetical protein
LAATEDGIEKGGPSGGSVTKSFSRSFGRAVRGLRDRGAIEVKKRPYSNLSEFGSLYPYRSPDRAVRDVRDRFLPLLERFIQDTNAAQFTAAGSERHLAKERPADVRAEARQKWDATRPAVLRILADTGDDRRSRCLLAIVMKGEELFQQAPLEHGRSMQQLLKAFEDAGGERGAVAPIRDIYAAFMPRSLRDLGNFKRRLYAAVDLSKDQIKPALKPDFLGWLLENANDDLVRLPGHRPADDSDAPGFFALRPEGRTTFSPLLKDHLVGRDALAPVSFLSAHAGDSRL